MAANALPLFLAGVSGGILHAFWLPWFKVAPLLLFLPIIQFVSRKNRGLLLWILCGLAVGFVDARVRAPSLPAPPPESPVTLEGRVSGFPEIREERIRFVIDSDRYGKVRVTVPRTARMAHGDRVQVQGRLKEIRGFLNPGVFNHAARPRREGIFFRLYAEDVRILAEGPGAFRRLDLLRRERVSHFEVSFRPDQASLLKAVILGVTDMPDELREDFSRSGTAHLLAVSGTHLSLLGLILFFIARKGLLALPHRFYLGLSQRISATGMAILLVLPVLLFYCGVSGSRIPTVRSLIMILAFLLAALLGRRRSWSHAVCLAAVLLLLAQPYALLDVSFQFTFVVVTVIGLGMGRQDAPASGKAMDDRVKTWTRLFDYLKKLFLTSFVASLGLAPLTAFYFQNISLAAPVSNLLAMPLAGFLVIPLGVPTPT